MENNGDQKRFHYFYGGSFTFVSSFVGTMNSVLLVKRKWSNGKFNPFFLSERDFLLALSFRACQDVMGDLNV